MLANTAGGSAPVSDLIYGVRSEVCDHEVRSSLWPKMDGRELGTRRCSRCADCPGGVRVEITNLCSEYLQVLYFSDCVLMPCLL